MSGLALRREQLSHGSGGRGHLDLVVVSGRRIVDAQRVAQKVCQLPSRARLAQHSLVPK